MIRFRQAADADLDRIFEIHANAFPDPRSADVRTRNFTENSWGRLHDLVVIEDDGGILAHAFLFPLTAYFGGVPVRVGGVASVGVAPEARGRGLATALLAHIHDASAARNDAITMLYAFRQGFYRRVGYATTTPTRHLTLAPRSIPDAWRREARATPVRPARGEDLPGLYAAYERAARRTTGWLERTTQFWESRVLDERRVVLVAGGPSDVVGYVAWRLAQTEPHAPIVLRVDEVVADDPAVRRRLLGTIGLQSDQVAEVTLDVDAVDPIDRALVDADGHRYGDAAVEHAIGVVSSGPLVRIHDAARALEARGYRRDGDVAIDVDGAGVLSIRVHGGRAHVERTSAPPDLATDATGVAAIAFGGLAPSDAVAIGVARATSPERLEAADAIFALPPFFALDPF